MQKCVNTEQWTAHCTISNGVHKRKQSVEDEDENGGENWFMGLQGELGRKYADTKSTKGRSFFSLFNPAI